MINKALPITLIVFFTFLAGACSNSYVKQDALKNVRTIYFDSNILVPDGPDIQGENTFVASLFAGGVVGSLLASDDERFKAFMNKNDIHIDKIVLDEFKKSFLSNNRYKVAARGEAALQIDVDNYGLARTLSLTEIYDRKPLLGITARLILNDGSVVWEQRKYITNLSSLTVPYDIRNLATDPKLLEEAFRQAAKVVISELSTDLHKY